MHGRRVLDVGCGTGTLAAALAEDYLCKVWGIDASPAMLEVARRKMPEGVGLKLAVAEDLPFKDGWFERAVSMLAVHHFDRPRAFAELRRVLAADGRFVLATFDPTHFAEYYLNRYFPSILEVDTARFPASDALLGELRDAGFAEPRCTRLTHRAAKSREQALDRIRGRHISTFQLISDEEYAAGLELAERELPEQVEYEQHWLVVSAGLSFVAR